MLTTSELEDFRGIGEGQHMEFQPFTLLFVSHGNCKSTALKAPPYLHEVIVRACADVSHTNLGGEVVDRGGFHRLISRREANRTMAVHPEFTMTESIDPFNRDPEGVPLTKCLAEWAVSEGLS